ncbi:TonB-dependent receptor plug domain-containing protein [Paraflavisolibacter sp. H34]|uniref:TonB-dependent receptor n=1 Tax=Huijunlia imazamoxiresistens TaxID=3127457 RepID=UPI00301A0DD8
MSLSVCSQFARAQADTAREIKLEEVVVKAYEQNRRLREVPAAVNYVGRQALERFSPASVVQAVNTLPGVRMEERSPGSYRFNIRGSSLRAPFGVRNVKVYYNDLPLTDPGGQTYLNQLGYYNFHSMEVIKGPGSSLYGAGTGGVLLVESLDDGAAAGAEGGYTAASYGGQQVYGVLTTRKGQVVNRLSFQHQESDGYRRQSKLRRDVHSWDLSARWDGDRELKATFLYGDLFYETPGALTLAEFRADPKAARPAAGAFPSAAAAGASIRQQTFLAGATYTQPVFSHLQNKSTVYGAFTSLRNPNTRGYDRSSEPHFGLRTVFTGRQTLGRSDLRLLAGLEAQEGFASAYNYKNVGGRPDSLRYSDDIRNRNFFVFTQGSWELNNWLLEAGASWNLRRLSLQRFTPRALGEQKRRFNNEVAPRVSLSKRWAAVTAYGSVARGFSPPSTSELAPTGSSINLDLQAEEGINYDLGFRATLLKHLNVDVNAFTFSLDQTIVQRRDAGGGDYYINAGGTRQRGLESYASYPLLRPSAFFRRSLLWASHTWHYFRYKEFKQAAADYSGHQMPVAAPHTVSSGFDLLAHNGLGAALTYYFSDRIPLNDANTDYAPAYHLLGARVSFERTIKEVFRWKLSAGADNLLDQRYSLGNDTNGAGGRYYNAAPGRNYYASLVLQWIKPNKE